MIEAVFISDLHLHPDEKDITNRFFSFIDWVATHARTLYILGDFFHVWPGDDAMDAWSCSIAEKLAWLASQGVSIYFMHGNRDFLLGERFATKAHMTILSEPTIIELNQERILLVHGDRYCTKDRAHQWFRRITRNGFFLRIFLTIPYQMRRALVNKVRKRSSQGNQVKTEEQLDIVPECMLSHMQKLQVRTIIHGHTHRPGLTTHQYHGNTYQQYILSDWDDIPTFMCYDTPHSLYFDRYKG